jgi:DNA-binding CsgD family transcriptional regulator
VASLNVHALTDRQLHILSLIYQKLTNGEIAEQMGYSESTIRQETMRIFDKLQVQGRHEARTYFEANKIKLGFTSKSNAPLEVVRDIQEATGS